MVDLTSQKVALSSRTCPEAGKAIAAISITMAAQLILRVIFPSFLIM